MKRTNGKFKPLRFDTLDTGCMVNVSHARSDSGHPVYMNPLTRISSHMHRVIYELLIGPVPDDKSVCHTCDNPACCNPSHLFLGTHQENMIDMSRKGRQRCQKLTCEQVLEIRSRPSTQTHKAIGLEFGVSRETISSIKRNKTWKHVEPIESNRTSHLPIPDDGDSINHQPHTVGRESYCAPVLLTNTY